MHDIRDPVSLEKKKKMGKDFSCYIVNDMPIMTRCFHCDKFRCGRKQKNIKSMFIWIKYTEIYDQTRKIIKEAKCYRYEVENKI